MPKRNRSSDGFDHLVSKQMKSHSDTDPSQPRRTQEVEQSGSSDEEIQSPAAAGQKLLTTTNIQTNVSSIKPMDGTNYRDWKDSMILYLANTTMDLALREQEPPTLTAESTAAEKAYREIWEHSNKACFALMKHTFDIPINQHVLKGDKAKNFLKSVSQNYKTCDEGRKDRYLSLLENSKYDGVSGVNEHATKLVGYYDKLKSMGAELGERFLFRKVLQSLPPQFNPGAKLIKSGRERWTINKLIDIISQAEESMKKEKTHNVKSVASSSGTKINNK